ncbi:hypothetical protein DMUE_6064 [Dictyocoela muelleri]|nr:hypothetical protein DMUE_6064 [Dictyocoela muelleri]
MIPTADRKSKVLKIFIWTAVFLFFGFVCNFIYDMMFWKDESVPTYENSKFENYSDIDLEAFKDTNQDSPKQGHFFNETSENTAGNKKLDDHLAEEFKVKKEEESDNNSLDNDLLPFNDSADHDSELESLSNKDNLSNQNNTNIDTIPSKDTPNIANKNDVYETGIIIPKKNVKPEVENMIKSSCPEEIIDLNQDFNILKYINSKIEITFKEMKYENTPKDHEKSETFSKNKQNSRSKEYLNGGFEKKK